MKLNAVFGVALLFLIVSMASAKEVTALSDYVHIDVTPAQQQKELLKTVVSMSFPDQIHSVGQALRYALEYSGYHLLEPAASHPAMVILMDHPLPMTHRRFEYVTLEKLLLTLAGSPYALVTDPIDRSLTFVPTVEYRAHDQ